MGSGLGDLQEAGNVCKGKRSESLNGDIVTKTGKNYG